MVVYSIICDDGNAEIVSCECYRKYDDAVKFIETRSGNPKKISDYFWITKDCNYIIKPLDVK